MSGRGGCGALVSFGNLFRDEGTAVVTVQRACPKHGDLGGPLRLTRAELRQEPGWGIVGGHVMPVPCPLCWREWMEREGVRAVEMRIVDDSE